MPEKEHQDNAKDLSSLSGLTVPGQVALPPGFAPPSGAFGLPTGVNPFMIPFDPDSPAFAGASQEQLLFPEKRKRELGERVCYGTGISYLSGLSTGGVWGFVEGMRHREATSARLQLTTVLNAMTKRGPFLGNRFGVLALGYNMFAGGLHLVRDEEDALNSVVAGAVTGVIFQSTSGPRGIIAGLLAGSLLGGVLGSSEAILDSFK